MKNRTVCSFEFVDAIPEEVNEGVLYICVGYATAIHNCFCGCGSEVVTPLSPTYWTLLFDGKSVSLSPSIGSWSLPCRSHYWIRNNHVEWARQLSAQEIESGRHRDQVMKSLYYGESQVPEQGEGAAPGRDPHEGWLELMWRRLVRRFATRKN